MFRNLRSFSAFTRPFFRSSTSLLAHDGPITIQRVRFVRPVLTQRRLTTALLYVGSSTCFWYYVIRPIDDEDEDEEGEEVTGESLSEISNKAEKGRFKVKEGDNKGEEEDEDDDEEAGDAADTLVASTTSAEDSFFIPLGWPRLCPQTFYKGSDPEWQSFIDFSRDRQRSMYIRNELAGLVGAHLATMKGFVKSLGSPITTQKYWLDVDFPDGPPQEYERGGIEITDYEIAWTTRPVSPVQMGRLQNILWPKAVAFSFLASFIALWSLQVAKLKDSLNIKSSSDNPNPKTPQGYINFQGLAKTSDKQQSHPGPGVDKPPESKSSDTDTDTSINPSKPATTESARVLPPLPPVPQPGEDMSVALGAFKRMLKQTWKPASGPAPRGTFIVSGMVEVQGPKGVCVLDVRGAYHPKEARWVSIGIGLRRLQPRKQSPKGGI